MIQVSSAGSVCVMLPVANDDHTLITNQRLSLLFELTHHIKPGQRYTYRCIDMAFIYHCTHPSLSPYAVYTSHISAITHIPQAPCQGDSFHYFPFHSIGVQEVCQYSSHTRIPAVPIRRVMLITLACLPPLVSTTQGPPPASQHAWLQGVRPQHHPSPGLPR